MALIDALLDNIYILLVLALIAIYIAAVYYLNKRKILERYNMGLTGPFLMIRTERGKGLIDRLAVPKRFWRIYGSVSIVVVLISMIAMFVLLFVQALYATEIPAESAPTPQMLLGLPGINPLLPFWYSLVGLIIAMVLHEFAHGILTRVADIKVKSLGILAFVLPMGAFVEPDEEEVNKTQRVKRARIFAVGPATNMAAAVIFALIFSWSMMASVEPVQDGMLISKVSVNSPIDHAGIRPGAIIVSINNTPVRDRATFNAAVQSVNMTELYAGNGTYANYSVPVTIYYRGGLLTLNVTPINKYDYYRDNAAQYNRAEYNGTAFFGISVYDLEVLSSTLAAPIRSGGSTGEVVGNLLFYGGTLPVSGMAPFSGDIAGAYKVNGPWAAIPADVFWVLANTIYYIFWINIIVGLSNALPAVPMDGGIIFKDTIDAIFARSLFRARLGETPEEAQKRKDKQERALASVVYTVSLLVLFLILWQLVGPRI